MINREMRNRLTLCEPDVDRQPALAILPKPQTTPGNDSGAIRTEMNFERGVSLPCPAVGAGWARQRDALALKVIGPKGAIAVA